MIWILAFSIIVGTDHMCGGRLCHEDAIVAQDSLNSGRAAVAAQNVQILKKMFFDMWAQDLFAY